MRRSGSELESHRFRPSGRIPSLCRLHQIQGHSAWEEHKGERRPLELILTKDAHVWRGALRKQQREGDSRGGYLSRKTSIIQRQSNPDLDRSPLSQVKWLLNTPSHPGHLMLRRVTRVPEVCSVRTNAAPRTRRGKGRTQ